MDRCQLSGTRLLLTAVYFSTSSAVDDGVRKHSPCPLIATAGAQRKPGVQVRLVAGSPKASKRPHLNHGFKVVSRASPSAEDFQIRDSAHAALFSRVGWNPPLGLAHVVLF